MLNELSDINEYSKKFASWEVDGVVSGAERGLGFLIDLKPLLQNLLHVPLFAALSILFFQVLSGYEIEKKRAIFIILIATIGFGLFNELIQLVIPGRYPSLVDMTLNTIGIVLGLWLYVYLEKRSPSLIRNIVCK